MAGDNSDKEDVLSQSEQPDEQAIEAPYG